MLFMTSQTPNDSYWIDTKFVTTQQGDFLTCPQNIHFRKGFRILNVNTQVVENLFCHVKQPFVTRRNLCKITQKKKNSSQNGKWTFGRFSNVISILSIFMIIWKFREVSESAAFHRTSTLVSIKSFLASFCIQISVTSAVFPSSE